MRFEFRSQSSACQHKLRLKGLLFCEPDRFNSGDQSRSRLISLDMLRSCFWNCQSFLNYWDQGSNLGFSLGLNQDHVKTNQDLRDYCYVSLQDLTVKTNPNHYRFISTCQDVVFETVHYFFSIKTEVQI